MKRSEVIFTRSLSAQTRKVHSTKTVTVDRKFKISKMEIHAWP